MELKIVLAARNLAVDDDVSLDLLTQLNDSLGGSDESPVARVDHQRFGEFVAVDPDSLQLILSITQTGAAGILLKGLLDCLLQWQKRRSQPMTLSIGDVSITVPANASSEDIRRLNDNFDRVINSVRQSTNTPNP